MAKYTEGKWKLHKSLPDDAIYSDTAEGIVTIARIRHQEVPQAVQDANALLICAAPDMYEALKFFIKELAKDYEYLDKGIGISTEHGKAMLNARKAITKAEGKS